MLCTPLVLDGFKWNFESIKALYGQRKLHFRLKVDTRKIISEDPKNVQEEDQIFSSIDITIDTAQLPSNSNNWSSREWQDLMKMFPTKTQTQIQLALTEHDNMNGAVLALTTSVTEENDILATTNLEPKKPMNLPERLNYLSSAFLDEKEKLKVELEDILNDSFVYYKDPSFDPRRKLQIQIKAQPAADTGGVARQYFTVPMEDICDKFFKGVLTKVPVYNINTIAGGVMKYIGKMVVHNILHGGPGTPIFCEAIYWYFVTGSCEAAAERVTVNDCSERVKWYVEKAHCCNYKVSFI